MRRAASRSMWVKASSSPCLLDARPVVGPALNSSSVVAHRVAAHESWQGSPPPRSPCCCASPCRGWRPHGPLDATCTPPWLSRRAPVAAPPASAALEAAVSPAPHARVERSSPRAVGGGCRARCSSTSCTRTAKLRILRSFRVRKSVAGAGSSPCREGHWAHLVDVPSAAPGEHSSTSAHAIDSPGLATAGAPSSECPPALPWSPSPSPRAAGTSHGERSPPLSRRPQPCARTGTGVTERASLQSGQCTCSAEVRRRPSTMLESS
mmetsp:Transcript_7752/g.22872  ORF Transcript_7752/g.22872 Transcript_7752/m.22872 type:complete len:265 (-) Transcript_7752:780-1574(-)